MNDAASEALVVGIDVGGTKIVAGAVRGTEVLDTVEHPTDVSSGEAVLDGIETTVREVLENGGRPTGVGIGVPSQIDYAAGRVLSSVNIPVNGVYLRDDLSERLGLPVFLDNDANCAALAEAELAEGGPVDHLVMLTLGTGVGGGVVIDGRVFRGAIGLGAELGHLVIESDGPECPGSCPNRGCLEALCSGQALSRDAGALAAERPDSRLAELARKRGGPPTGADAVTAAREEDSDALALFERFGTALGVGMASLMNVFEPEQLVVGGGLSNVADLYLPRATEEARSRVLPEIGARVKISVASSGAQAGLIGGAKARGHRGSTTEVGRRSAQPGEAAWASLGFRARGPPPASQLRLPGNGARPVLSARRHGRLKPSRDPERRSKGGITRPAPGTRVRASDRRSVSGPIPRGGKSVLVAIALTSFPL